jgi:hypothetical protein
MRFPLLLLLVLGSIVTRVPGVESHGRTIPDQATIGDTVVPLRGAELLKWKLLIKLYVAALYLPSGVATTPQAAVDASPKRLLMYYSRDIPREKMVEATDETIGNGLTPEARAALQTSLTTWNALYPAPREDDIVCFDHLPGGTLIMTHNGKELGRITDEAFARALFAIWIGTQPVKESLRDRLIGAP